MFNYILPKASYFHHFSPNPRIFWADPSPNPRPGQIFIHKFVFNGTFTTTSLILSEHGPSLTTAFILGGPFPEQQLIKGPEWSSALCSPGRYFIHRSPRRADGSPAMWPLSFLWCTFLVSVGQIDPILSSRLENRCVGEKKAAGKRCKKRSRDPEKEPWRGTCSGLSKRAEVAQKHRQNTSQKESSSS